jgi:preprotein translocase subunit YajC
MIATALMNGLFAFGAPAQPGTTPDPRAQTLQLIGPLVFAFILMYFIVFRPEQKKRRAQSERLKSLKSGDRVVTTAGIIGVVVGVKDKSVSIRSADTKLEVLKSSVSEILEKSAATEA